MAGIITRLFSYVEGNSVEHVERYCIKKRKVNSMYQDNGSIRGYVPKHSAKNQEQMQQGTPQQYQQPQYQQQQYQQPQYQQTQYQQTQYREEKHGGVAAFFAARDKVLLIGAALALLWLIFSYVSVRDVVNSVPTDDSFEALGAQIGTTIGLAMLMPYFIVTALGTIFNWVGWLISKKGFALTAAILFCVALPLGVGNAVGLIPSLVLCFVGYSRLKKQEAAQQ